MQEFGTFSCILAYAYTISWLIEKFDEWTYVAFGWKSGVEISTRKGEEGGI
jgi:hypothetical protein